MAADIRARWGLPDWRAAAEYPAPDVSLRRWGWEFLRRRDDYRASWVAAEHRAEPIPNGLLVAVADDYQVMRRDFGMSLVVDPGAQLSEWDLSQFLQFPPFGYGVGYRDESIARAEQKEQKKAIMFDLERPLAPQLDAARSYLDRVQGELGEPPRSPKNRVRHWPQFLRALDARECGATFAAIASTLRTGLDAQSARDCHKAAVEVQRRAPFLL